MKGEYTPSQTPAKYVESKRKVNEKKKKIAPKIWFPEILVFHSWEKKDKAKGK